MHFLFVRGGVFLLVLLSLNFYQTLDQAKSSLSYYIIFFSVNNQTSFFFYFYFQKWLHMVLE
jgi:hypothetical protein